MPERSAGTVACMVGEERRVSLGRRLLSARLAVGLGIVAFVLNIAALVLIASANRCQSTTTPTPTTGAPAQGNTARSGELLCRTGRGSP